MAKKKRKKGSGVVLCVSKKQLVSLKKEISALGDTVRKHKHPKKK